MALALEKAREEREDALHLSVFFFLRALGESAELEIFAHSHRGKKPAPLRHQRDAMFDDPLRRGFADHFILPSNRTRARGEQTGNSFEQCRFAGAVGADERDHLAWPYYQVHALESQ